MARGLFRRLFGQGGAFPPVQPDEPLFVIGDLHGCADLLVRLLEKADPDDRIVCVGDYVDRGEQSADVVALLQGRPDILCLRGNHEDMLLKFLEEPEEQGPRWLRYGGLQTLASFGVSGISENARGKALVAARDRLAEALGPDHLDWLEALPFWHQSGNVAIVHAAADPGLPLAHQLERTLLWGHPDFLSSTRSDGVWVAHGHTIVDTPQARDGRIPTDTGAYATGRLTAARITTNGVSFIDA